MVIIIGSHKQRIECSICGKTRICIKGMCNKCFLKIQNPSNVQEVEN